MRQIPSGLAAHVAAGVTTLCRCWRLVRNDGAVLGFTDHDRALAFDGTDYEPAGGLDASEDVREAGFATGGMEVAGALSSERIDAADLAAGLYDAAEVTVYLVNWTAPEERLTLRKGRLGEVTREDGAFRAEIRGLAAALDQPNGRAFRHTCDADLGDARCGVDLDGAAYRGTGAVIAAGDRRRFSASGLGSFASAWFERGRLVWTDGENAGLAAEIRTHQKSGSTVTVELWQPAARNIDAGDGFTVTAGCDKRFSTCRTRFANGLNFRGFPHMPGNDFVLFVARAGDGNSGAPVVP